MKRSVYMISGLLAMLALCYGLWADHQAQSAFTITAAGAGLATVGSSSLRTADGSVTGGSSAVEIVMNEFSFFPSYTGQGSTMGWASSGIADPGNTIGRVLANSAANSGTWQLRWKYMTATDSPRLWVTYDGVSGLIDAAWISDDPCTKDDTTPCITQLGKLTKKFVSSDLTPITFSQRDIDKASEFRRQKGYLSLHQLYRQLQEKANDRAPSQFIVENMKINISNGKLICKGAC